MGRKKEYLILNYDEVDINSIVLGVLKYDEQIDKNHMEIRYKQDTKKSSFYIQSQKVLLEKNIFIDTYEDYILDIISKDKVFSKFIRKIEQHIINIITESYNNKKLNINYKNRHKLQEYFKSNILINDKIRMNFNYNEVSFFNYDKNELSFEEFRDNLNENTFIYVIYTINNIYFENNFYYIDFDVKQIQICKIKKKHNHKIPDYQFILNETILEETNMNNDYPEHNKNLNSNDDSDDNNDSDDNKQITTKYNKEKILNKNDNNNHNENINNNNNNNHNENINDNDNESSDYENKNDNSDEEIDMKMLEKHNLLSKIMKDLDSTS